MIFYIDVVMLSFTQLFRIKEDGANSQRTQEQVVGVWNLLFDRDRNDPDNDVSRKDVNALLESIHEELNG